MTDRSSDMHSADMDSKTLQAPVISTRVLMLIEDNPADADLVAELLADEPSEPFEIVHVPALKPALQALQTAKADVIVLDLGLPDAGGVESIRRIRQTAAEVPIVVLTGQEDPDLALACIDAGAQDRLPKSEVRPRALRRAIGYAMSRAREGQLRELQETLAHYRSMSAQAQSTSVTATLSGSGMVSARYPELFASIVRSYFGMLEPFLWRTTDRVDASRESKEIIITTLGDASGGPRDLLEVHVAALDRALTLYHDPHSRTIVYESRLLALEMMGLLVDYYRVGHRRRFSEGLSS